MTSNLFTSVWLLKGLTGSESGKLQLKGERVLFTLGNGTKVFDVARSEITGVDFPWINFGAGMVIKIGSASHRISFVRPGNTAMGEYGFDIGSGRAACKEWRAALGK